MSSDESVESAETCKMNALPEWRVNYEIGLRHRELCTILNRIRRRRDGCPRGDELPRMQKLRADIRSLKTRGVT